MDWKCSYTLDLSCPKRQRLEVSENVKYIAVTLKASKLQVTSLVDIETDEEMLKSKYYLRWMNVETYFNFCRSIPEIYLPFSRHWRSVTVICVLSIVKGEESKKNHADLVTTKIMYIFRLLHSKRSTYKDSCL